jgi:predicted phosphohydrolase
MKACWITDPHLDHNKGNTAFYESVKSTHSDCVLITGDIAEAKDVHDYVEEMEREFDIPIYYVMGNHDYYGGSMSVVRSMAESISDYNPNINWLPYTGVAELCNGVALCGVDGWYDGRYGTSNPPKVVMCDWRLIDELKPFQQHQESLLLKLQEIADAEAELAELYLREAAGKYHTVYFLTHVPPWVEAAWHRHNWSDKGWAPWFTSKAIGDVIEDVAAEFPLTNFEVLCGHTHSRGEFLVAPNLRCRTAAAEYGKPAIETIIYIR